MGIFVQHYNAGIEKALQMAKAMATHPNIRAVPAQAALLDLVRDLEAILSQHKQKD